MKLTEKKVRKQGPRKEILYLLKFHMKLHLRVTLLRTGMDLEGTKQKDNVIFIFNYSQHILLLLLKQAVMYMYCRLHHSRSRARKQNRKAGKKARPLL